MRRREAPKAEKPRKESGQGTPGYLAPQIIKKVMFGTVKPIGQLNRTMALTA